MTIDMPSPRPDDHCGLPPSQEFSASRSKLISASVVPGGSVTLWRSGASDPANGPRNVPRSGLDPVRVDDHPVKSPSSNDIETRVRIARPACCPTSA